MKRPDSLIDHLRPSKNTLAFVASAGLALEVLFGRLPLPDPSQLLARGKLAELYGTCNFSKNQPQRPDGTNIQGLHDQSADVAVDTRYNVDKMKAHLQSMGALPNVGIKTTRVFGPSGVEVPGQYSVRTEMSAMMPNGVVRPLETLGGTLVCLDNIPGEIASRMGLALDVAVNLSQYQPNQRLRLLP